MRVRMFPPMLAALVVLAGCASIPSEAPELSMELGNRISALEGAHLRLLEEFFREKRQRVDVFVQEEWVPLFAAEFFGQPKVEAMWAEVVKSKDPEDRLRFIVMVGPKLQEKINSKRVELIQPLDELEAAIKSKIEGEYDQTRAINNTLTAFLDSASKVDENRRRYLEMVGVTQSQIDQFVDETDKAVSDLVGAAQGIENREKDTEEFRAKIESIIQELRK